MDEPDNDVGRHIVGVVEAADAEVENVEEEGTHTGSAEEDEARASGRDAEQTASAEEESVHDNGASRKVIKLLCEALVACMEDGGPEPSVDADERVDNVDELERESIGELLAEHEQRLCMNTKVE